MNGPCNLAMSQQNVGIGSENQWKTLLAGLLNVNKDKMKLYMYMGQIKGRGTGTQRGTELGNKFVLFYDTCVQRLGTHFSVKYFVSETTFTTFTKDLYGSK